LRLQAQGGFPAGSGAPRIPGNPPRPAGSIPAAWSVGEKKPSTGRFFRNTGGGGGNRTSIIMSDKPLTVLGARAGLPGQRCPIWDTAAGQLYTANVQDKQLQKTLSACCLAAA